MCVLNTFFGFDLHSVAEDLLRVVENILDHRLLYPHLLERHVSVTTRRLDVFRATEIKDENIKYQNSLNKNTKCYSYISPKPFVYEYKVKRAKKVAIC